MTRIILILLAIVLLSVAILALLTSGQDPAALLSIFSTRFLGIFIEAAPFLLLGTLVSGLIDAFVTTDDIARIVPRHPVLAALFGGLLGFIFPVCECGVVPVVRKLFNKGLPLWVGITFLLAAPVINPVVLVSTWAAFGFSAVFFGRFLGTLLIAVAVGLIFALGARPQDILRPMALLPVQGGSGAFVPARRPTLRGGLALALRSATRDFFDMGRYLILGSLLAAGMQTLVPQESLLQLGGSPTTSVLVMVALAFLLSVCSTVDAFLALAFVGTFTGGSIITFLTFGPMVDVKSTLMFLGVFKRRTVAYLVILPLLLSVLLGIWLNLNIGM